MNSTILTAPMDGSERFRDSGKALPANVKDFWAWAMSRLLGDGPRGDLAEYLVRLALGADLLTPKKGWGEYDVKYGRTRIEVKSSAYLQAWERDAPSAPTFGIAPTAACDIQLRAGQWRYTPREKEDKPCRRSDLYVFCLFAEQDRSRADVMELSQWEFYVAPTALIDAKCGSRKSITLSGLARLPARKCSFAELKTAVEEAISSLG